MSCLIIGDSIAKGVADIRKDCQAYTEVGISTLAWSKKWLKRIDLVADTVFISLGSNDRWYDFENVADELYKIRISFDGRNVVWALPANKTWIRELIEEIAYEYGDTMIELRELSHDRVHPTIRGYKALAGSF
jgi:lysophospholipase L1-like esterase